MDVGACLSGILADGLSRLSDCLADSVSSSSDRVRANLGDVVQCGLLAPLALRVDQLDADDDHENDCSVKRVSALGLLLRVNFLFSSDLGAQLRLHLGLVAQLLLSLSVDAR